MPPSTYLPKPHSVTKLGKAGKNQSTTKGLKKINNRGDNAPIQSCRLDSLFFNLIRIKVRLQMTQVDMTCAKNI